MTTFQRKYLRQTLGRDYLADTIVGNASNTVAVGGSFALMDTTKANLAFSGENLYPRSYLRVSSEDFRVASFNVGSGAFITLQTSGTALVYSAEYEVHRLLSPADKDRALNVIISRLAVKQEYPIASVKDQHFYAISNSVRTVLDAYYFGDPANSLDRDKTRFNSYDVVTTPTGRELRIDPSLGGTEQIILDAIVTATLGSSDAATVNLPENGEAWVLYGAEAQCWEMLRKSAPGKESAVYAQNAQRAWAAFSGFTSKNVNRSRDYGFKETI